MFGLSNQVVVTFKEENTMTFKHLFLKDYDESSGASFAVYTQDDVYKHIFYAVDQVRKRSMDRNHQFWFLCFIKSNCPLIHIQKTVPLNPNFIFLERALWSSLN